MHPATLALMFDQVRAIFRALTGSDMPEAPERTGEAERPSPPVAAGEAPSFDEVARRFAELEAAARSIPAVVERVPPFSFAPLMDAYEERRELVLQIAVPGIERADVDVERSGDLLVVSGVRRGEPAANGRSFLHAEIPRGPFHRVIRIPYPTSGEPRVSVADGLIEIRIGKTAGASA